MADKFRKTIPIRITFSSGEQPTPEKLNVVTDQVRNGVSLIEKAVGDIWGQSGDSSFQDAPVQIASLARTIGQAKNLNPTLYAPSSDFDYTETLGTSFATKHTGSLNFVPTTSGTFSGTGAFLTKQSALSSVTSTGDYFIDSLGHFHTYSPVGVSDTLTYTVDISTWPLSDRITPCVIPDPNQDGFTSCKLYKSGGRYYLKLPPRRPISSFPFGQPSSYPITSGNEDTVLSSPPKLWQAKTVDAIESSFYKYSLPNEISAIISASGSQIPEGYIYLWDQTNNTVIEDIVFLSTSSSHIFELVSTSQTTFLDGRVISSSAESESDYNSCYLSLIIPAAQISDHIASLWHNVLSHSHSVEDVGNSFDHNSLSGLNTNSANSAMASYLPTSWDTSNWAHDGHTSLLNRCGSHGVSSGSNRDPYDNAMLGDLLLANADLTGVNYIDEYCTDESFRIRFGSKDGRASIYSTSYDVLGTLKPSIRVTPSLDVSDMGAVAWYSSSSFSGTLPIGTYWITVLGVDKLGRVGKSFSISDELIISGGVQIDPSINRGGAASDKFLVCIASSAEENGTWDYYEIESDENVVITNFPDVGNRTGTITRTEINNYSTNNDSPAAQHYIGGSSEYLSTHSLSWIPGYLYVNTVRPIQDNEWDLGSSTERFKDAFLGDVFSHGTLNLTTEVATNDEPSLNIRMYNDGTTISAGSWVEYDTVSNGVKTISTGRSIAAPANGELSLGVATDNIAANSWGYIATKGLVKVKADTGTVIAGQAVIPSSLSAGNVTGTSTSSQYDYRIGIAVAPPVTESGYDEVIILLR